MKLLNIKLPAASILIEPKPLVLSLIKDLFTLKEDYKRKACCDEIEKYWGALSLSASCELIFLAFIDRMKLEDIKKDKFFDAIGSFKMHEFLKKNHWAKERMIEIARRRLQLLTTSYNFIRLADIFAQDEQLEQEFQSLEWAQSPSMFYLMIQIILALEALGALSEEITLSIKAQIMTDYSLFMRKLAPLFCVVQEIAINQEKTFSMNGLDLAINGVLMFLGQQAEGPVLAIQVKEILLEKKYLQVDEAIQQHQLSI